MRAAVTVAPGRMELRDLPEPEPGPGEALVRIETVGLCGSDLHLYLGKHPYSRFPNTQGHELAGTVVAVGDGYAGRASVGERVAIEPLISCGVCYPCRRGRPNCCVDLKVLGAHVPGGMAELFAVPADCVHPVGDLEPELAALAEPVSIAMQGVGRGGIDAGERVAVFGAGPIGQAVLLAATDLGARVLVTDLLESRLALAERLGAEVVVRADRQDPAEAVAEWTDGEGAAVTVEATGVPAVLRTAVDAVAHAGRVVVIGISTADVSLPMVELTRKELTILGSRNNAGVFPRSVDLVRRNRGRIGQLITHRFGLEQAPEAIEFALRNPQLAEKVLLDVAPAPGG